MKNNSPFPFRTIKEAWDYFTKAARMHFAKLIKQGMDKDPTIRLGIKNLKHRDYCARLLYVLNMFAFEGDHEGEFDLDWAMLLAKPLSAKQARQSIRDLMELGFMGEIEVDEFYNDNEQRKLGDGNGHGKSIPPKEGGDVTRDTPFNFD